MKKRKRLFLLFKIILAVARVSEQEIMWLNWDCTFEHNNIKINVSETRSLGAAKKRNIKK